MATVEKRKGGFRVVFWYQGQRFQRTLSTAKKSEADALKARVEENLQLLQRGRLTYNPGDDLALLLLTDGRINAAPKASKPVSLGKLLKEYRKHASVAKEENTQYTERIHIKHLLRILGRRTPLAAITGQQLQAYVAARAGEDGNSGEQISHVTIKKELGTLSSIWNRWAVRQNFVNAPLSLRNLEYPKQREKPPFQTWAQIERKIARGKLGEEEQADLWDSLFLTVPEIEDLLAFVREAKSPWTDSRFPWVYPMFTFAAHTGARRSEVLRSRVEDLDFEGNNVTIREKKKDRSKRETLRHVPMTPLLKEALREWLTRHPGGTLTFCKEPDVSFVPSMAHHYFRWTVDSGKWKVIRGWHTLRHSFISNLASRGVSERVIMALAGHLNRETTRRYAHLIPSTVQDAVDLVFGSS